MWVMDKGQQTIGNIIVALVLLTTISLIGYTVYFNYTVHKKCGAQPLWDVNPQYESCIKENYK